MSGKLLGTLLILICLCGAARAEPYGIVGCFGDKGSWSGGLSMVLTKGQALGSWPCGDEGCRARRDLACAANALDQRATLRNDYPPRGEAHRAWIGYGKVVLALGHQHPGRIPRYCSLLARAARTVSRSEDDRGRTAHDVAELATWLDRPRNRCLDAVLRNLPDVEAVREDRRDWNMWCMSDVHECQQALQRDYLQ